MNPVSVVIIARNEEANLHRCLGSVSWANEIILVDSGSTDRTVELAEELGARVVKTEWLGFGQSKRFGVDQAANDWILSIDADEEVTLELAREIKTLPGASGPVGYFIPRRTQFLGKWIYHCGWYPDPVLRLFQKSRGNFNDNLVHEGVETDGPTARLKNDLLHYSYPTLEDYLTKFNRYTTLAAQSEYKKGRRAAAYDITVRPAAALIKHYCIKRGFLDGLEGLLISVLSSCYVMVKYAKLRQLSKHAGSSTKDYQ